MARPDARLCAGGARGLPGPLLLAGLALLGAARARAAAGDGFSLHPPYFNLAEGARISASATCGEEAPARGAPRPTEDLYCKLVGGPVAGGDPNQTIQVRAGRDWVAAGRGGAAGTWAPGTDLAGSAQVWTEAPASRPDALVPHFEKREGPRLGRPGPARDVRAPLRVGGTQRPRLRRRGRRGTGPGPLASPSPGIPARAGLGLHGGCLWGGAGPLCLAPGQAGARWVGKGLRCRRIAGCSWSLGPEPGGPHCG